MLLEIIDWTDPTRNIYGCTKCPSCQGDKRYGTRRPPFDRLFVVCDDCGHFALAGMRTEAGHIIE